MAWDLFRRESGDGYESFGLDSDLLGSAPLGHLPVAVRLTVEAPSAAPDELAPTESAIDGAVAQVGGRLVGTIRTRTELWVLAYLSASASTAWIDAIPRPRNGTISAQIANDPEWKEFDVVRPDGIELQSMLDMRVFAKLFAAGDSGAERPIEHVITDASPGRRADLRTSIDHLGMAVAASDVEGGFIVTSRARPADVTPDSWTLKQIAERHGATYDGWGCEVVRDDPPATRRRWFRRADRTRAGHDWG